MKYFKRLLVIFALLVTVTGCGKNTKVLNCSLKTNGNNVNAYSKIDYTFEKDKLTAFYGEIEFKDIIIDNIEVHWESFKTLWTEQNKPVEEPGVKRTVKADDVNHTFTIIYDVDYKKASKDTLKEYEIDDYSGKSYDEIKKLAADQGMTCN
jgi:uncharacterized lipoprotein YehR (DUF1307 family)